MSVQMRADGLPVSLPECFCARTSENQRLVEK
jgi:hypothetical protein